VSNLRPLRREGPNYDHFIDALRGACLPSDDLEAGARFYVLQTEAGADAFGGLEGSGPDQLIRSVVVPPSARAQGLGRQVTEALAAQARLNGAERLWLLTTSADPFFAKLGWSVADRGDAPEAVRATRQFAGLCPASATLMCRSLKESEGV
jgi:N-acetylglutamate synthase-like GNAT family acetyltransferase